MEGHNRHVLREDAEALLAAEPSSAVRFLPGHDQWVMGAGTKEVHVVPPEHRAAVTRKANLVTVSGVVRGTWSTRGEELVVTWLDKGAPPRQDLEEEAGRLITMLGRPVRFVLKTG